MIKYSPKRYFLPLAFIILLILTALSYFVFRFFKTSPLDGVYSSPTPITSSTPIDIPGYKNYKIKSLNLNFSVPFEYNVEINEVPNDYTNFYIQNYPLNAPPPEPYFQMYGLYNETTLNYTDIQNIKKDLINPKEENIGSFRTIQGVTKGERVRFTYYILLEKGYLTIAVSDTAKENIEKAKSVIQTFNQTGSSTKKCIVGGCSNELCVESGSDTASICIWSDSFACYKDAVCALDTNGNCNWVMDEDLKKCLNKAGV